MVSVILKTMNYYDEIIEKISSLIDEKNYDLADRLISNELAVPYVPREVEEKLYRLKKRIMKDPVSRIISDEEIEEFLFQGDPQHQLIAVNELNDKNLRQYIGICERYLASKGYANAKALLADSLIRQEIDHLFHFRKENEIISFNPSLFTVIEASEPFLSASGKLFEDYMKEPSKLQLARQLLYKEFIMQLPDQFDQESAMSLEKNIVAYIDHAFDSAE